MRLSSFWAYFRRGHSSYTGLIISASNFIHLIYLAHRDRLPYISNLIIILSLVYPFLAACMGWVGFKTDIRRDIEFGAKANPWNRDVAKGILLVSEGRAEEARRLLEKWT